MSLSEYLERQLDALREADRFRDPADARARDAVRAAADEQGVEFLDTTSNDYLGLGCESGGVSRETPLGAGASRLVQGTHAEHEALERELADWVGLPAALLFSSGYAANVGALSALGASDALVVSDSLNHASLIDGMRLSRARVAIVPHGNLAAVEGALASGRDAAARWVVVESYFSMDGDIANLLALRALCERYRAFLVVDEAHALGVFGPSGAGLCKAAGVVPDVLVGTLGKSVGAQGAFVAGSEALRTFLWNRARSFVFSTAPSPALCAQARRRVRAAREADGARAALLTTCEVLRAELRRHELSVVTGSTGPIVPLLAGPSGRAMDLATALRCEGILAQPIRPPTVPEGFARLRLTVTARMKPDDACRLADAIVRAWRALD